MSLTDEIAEELHLLGHSKTCCVKSLVCGLLYSARQNDADRGYTASFYREKDARLAESIINARFASNEGVHLGTSCRGGHKTYTVTFYSRALCSVLFDIDSEKTKSIPEAVGFRCSECASGFLCGLFISSATVSTPKNGYSLEFSVQNAQRAECLQTLLDGTVGRAGTVKRGGRIGLYYKSSTRIADMLYLIGAHSASFELQNFFINRNIRSAENRATNCVTYNISRSVDSNKRYINAVNFIISNNYSDKLSEELLYTAKLRLEYDSASLSELAERHEPKISKSGLCSRLKKILSLAEELDTKEKV